MEKAIAVRDAIFWWSGVWALITGADAAVLSLLRFIDARREKQDRDKLESAMADLARKLRDKAFTVKLYDQDKEARPEEGAAT